MAFWYAGPETEGSTPWIPSQHDSLSSTRAALKPHDCMAAIDDGLASWLPSNMECSVTQAYSVPEVSAPRSTTTFPDRLTR